MIPTDLEHNGLENQPGESDSGVFTPSLAQLEISKTESLGTESSFGSSRSVSKQYMVVGLVLLISGGLLWFMRKEGLGAGIASGGEVAIEYPIDNAKPVADPERQRQLLFDLELSENPAQIPASELQKNPFSMAELKPSLPDDQVEAVVEPTGPTPEELRLQELDSKAEQLVLNTVLRGRVSLARINSKTYRIGDTVESDFILLSISERSVTLGADGNTYELTIDKKN
ncbi:MAG TPA: hypothetical protein ENJ00_06415 [Phycisphaerales bacterium]|nr:hypothetical protein [Phycisphaerales bacterium]